MAGVSSSQSKDLEFHFPELSRNDRLQKLVFAASLLGAQHKRDKVKHKPAS